MIVNRILNRLRSRTRKFLGIGKRPLMHKEPQGALHLCLSRERLGIPESVSGPGSARASICVQHVDHCTKIIAQNGIRSIADVPCGDFKWMPLLLKEHPEIDYRGYDIVKPLITANRKAHPHRRFRVLDITKKPPERADLIFSKDLVNHLLERDVWRALANMVRSGATYLVVTSVTDAVANVDLSENVGGASR